MPLPTSSLGHVFVYLFETDTGANVVDAGWNTDEAYAAVEAGLAEAGYVLLEDGDRPEVPGWNLERRGVVREHDGEPSSWELLSE